ncbi:IS3 family transposase [Clostridium estertheticum]|uniref:IS3 family transposase n=1 Tax=Clostridium estertheticum TaxID=238834 RepID=UPI001C0DF5E1|nr:IS3 family transposase [Clostridium estertheticum]MBU3179101.1 IS3 family transposase [Clostridium estertheticum]
MIEQNNNLLNISLLCQTAEVSRSGYYRWQNNVDTRNEKEELDKKDFELILEAYKFRGYDKGSRGMHMRFLNQGIRMNRKKIQRLMGKYKLICPIRKANPSTYGKSHENQQYF